MPICSARNHLSHRRCNTVSLLHSLQSCKDKSCGHQVCLPVCIVLDIWMQEFHSKVIISAWFTHLCKHVVCRMRVTGQGGRWRLSFARHSTREMSSHRRPLHPPAIHCHPTIHCHPFAQSTIHCLPALCTPRMLHLNNTAPDFQHLCTVKFT